MQKPPLRVVPRPKLTEADLDAAIRQRMLDDPPPLSARSPILQEVDPWDPLTPLQLVCIVVGWIFVACGTVSLMYLIARLYLERAA